MSPGHDWIAHEFPASRRLSASACSLGQGVEGSGNHRMNLTRQQESAGFINQRCFCLRAQRTCCLWAAFLLMRRTQMNLNLEPGLVFSFPTRSQLEDHMSGSLRLCQPFYMFCPVRGDDVCAVVTYNRDKSRDVQEASLKIISVPAPDVLSETITGPPAVDSLMKDGIKLHPQAAPPPPSIAHHFLCY